jgi:DNA-binding NarL/FixJ family response regulator
MTRGRRPAPGVLPAGGARGGDAAAAPHKSVRVLLADDHRLILDGVRRVLEAAGGLEVVGEATTGSQVLGLVRRTRPDVVLLDLRMPELDGLACLDWIKKRHPRVKVVVLSVSFDEKLVETVLARGASAYVVKSVQPVDLPGVIRRSLREDIDKVIGLPVDRSANAARAAGLTRRELAILTAVAQGKSNPAIAKELWVAEQTVKFHLTSIYRKLGVHNRTEAARRAYQKGFVDGLPFAAADDGVG